MKLSVIIPLLNSADNIEIQLKALSNQNWSEPWELVVSDNGSTDGSLSIVKQYREKLPNLHIVDASDIRGAAHARNVGALAASSDYLAFCDADDEVAPLWLKAMGEALQKYDVVCGARDINKLNKPEIVKAFSRPDWRPDKGISKFGNPPYLPYAATSNLGVKKSIHINIGGFDETLLHLEDIDYSWRIQLSGVKIQFFDKALVHYRLPSTLKGGIRKQYYSGEYQIALCERYRPFDMPELSLHKDMRDLIKILFCVKQIKVDKGCQYRWLFGLVYTLGRLKGHYK